MAVSETGSSIGMGGVIWLVVLFAGIVFWAFHPKNRQRHKKDGETPFQDDEKL